MNERKLLSASVAFVCIPRLKYYEQQTAYKVISALHFAARQCAKARNHGKFRVLTTLTGMILIAPDGKCGIIDLLKTIASKCYDGGFPIKVGITHGDIEELRDIDGTPNYIGTPINHAARLAFSEKNDGCLAEQSFKHYWPDSFGPHERPPYVFGIKSKIIKGKGHDQNFTCYNARRALLPIRSKLNQEKIKKLKFVPNSHIAGLIVAYDLPKFSAGDRLQLSQRFRGVAEAFRFWKANGSIPKESDVYLMPGGDGGIIVITEAKQIAFDIVSKFAEILKIESLNKTEEISVVARIGVHYGLAPLFLNGANFLRPTGQACFIADEIANDSIAKAKGQVVFSQALKDVESLGSLEHFKDKFEMLPPALSGSAKGIKRFVFRTIKAAEHPLFTKLTGSRGSWEVS